MLMGRRVRCEAFDLPARTSVLVPVSTSMTMLVNYGAKHTNARGCVVHELGVTFDQVKVIADPANAKAAMDIKGGKGKAIGALMGQIMKKSKGRVNAKIVRQMIQMRLGE